MSYNHLLNRSLYTPVRWNGSFGTTLPSTIGPKRVLNSGTTTLTFMISSSRLLRKQEAISLFVSVKGQLTACATWMLMTELAVSAQSARAVPLIRIARWNSPAARHKNKVQCVWMFGNRTCAKEKNHRPLLFEQLRNVMQFCLFCSVDTFNIHCLVFVDFNSLTLTL